MKYLLVLLLVILEVLPQTSFAQAFKIDIRDQRVVTFDDGSGIPTKEFHFRVYMSRVDNSPNPNENLYLATADLRLNFNSENFITPIFGLSLIGEIDNYPVTGTVIGTNVLSINIGLPKITTGVTADAKNIALAPGATYIGDFYVTGIKENPGKIGLTWRSSTASPDPTIVTKFLEDGSTNVTTISSLGQLVNPPSALLTDLHVHFTGDGGEDPNMYKIYVQSASDQALSAGSIGFYVYFSSSTTSLVYSTDSQVSGAPLNWGSTSLARTVVVEEGAWAGGFDRRYKYMHAAGATEGGKWPAYVDDPLRTDEGINIGSLRFNTTTLAGDPASVVKFEAIAPATIDAVSFTDFGGLTNYTLTIDGPTHPLGTAAGTLPVTLTTFSAVLEANHEVLLKWATAMEIDNKEFILQRSADPTAFTDLKSLPGAGNSTLPLHYTTIDESPLPGTSYYRLKQVDFNGTISFSKVVSIRNAGIAAAPITIKAAQPNPFRDQTVIHFSLPAETKVTLTLSDITGQVKETVAINGHTGANTYTLKGDKLANGLYILNLTDGRTNTSFKVLKGQR